MASIKEVERFEVRDDRGKSYTIVRLQEFVGARGDEILGLSSYETDTGNAVNWSKDEPDVYYLPFGFDTPWIAARKV